MSFYICKTLLAMSCLLLNYYEVLPKILRRKLVWRHNYADPPILEGMLLHTRMEPQSLVIFM